MHFEVLFNLLAQSLCLGIVLSIFIQYYLYLCICQCLHFSFVLQKNSLVACVLLICATDIADASCLFVNSDKAKGD